MNSHFLVLSYSMSHQNMWVLGVGEGGVCLFVFYKMQIDYFVHHTKAKRDIVLEQSNLLSHHSNGLITFLLTTVYL